MNCLSHTYNLYSLYSQCVNYSRPSEGPHGQTDQNSTMHPGGTTRVDVRLNETGATSTWGRQSYLEFRAMTSAVPCVRAHVRLVLGEWGLQELAHAAEQVVSELVTNAIRASDQLIGSRFGGCWLPGAPPVRLWLLSDSRTLLVEVWDGSERMPEPEAPALESEHGRGLWLVEALSEDWGAFQPAHASGKVVWAAVARP